MRQPSPVRRILIIKVSAIGDIVRTYPALVSVRRAWPDAHIAFMIGRRYVDLIEHCPHIQEIIPYDARRNLEDLSGYLRFVRGLRRMRFDLVLNFQNTQRFDILGRLIGAPVRSQIITNVHPTDGVTGVYKVLDTIGAPYERAAFEFWDTADDRAFAQRLLDDAGMRSSDILVGLNPGTNWRTKQWPGRHYAALGDMLQGEGYRVILFGGPEDAERAREIVSCMKTAPIVAAGRTSIREAASLIRHCSGFVSNDSGLMHIAALLNVPTVGIFGSTNPLFDGPVGPGHRSVYAARDCSPCYNNECKLDNDQLFCLTALLPPQVREALKQVMKSAAPGGAT